MLDGKYITRGNNEYFKDGDTVEFVEGYYICGGWCSACEKLKSVKTLAELKEKFQNIDFEKYVEKE